jgi:RimJ/RimL family protein N-acetyltransferase
MSRSRPTLETDRLTLTPTCEADMEDFVALDGDAEVMHFIRAVHPEGKRRAFWRRMLDEAKERSDGLGWWTVREKCAPEVFLGGVFLLPFRNLDLDRDEVELGYRYARSAWGRGIATEAGRALARHGLSGLEMPELMAVVNPQHTRSLNVLRKIGFLDRGKADYHGQRLPCLVLREVTNDTHNPAERQSARVSCAE